MTNLDKYNQAFMETFGVTEAALPELTYQSLAEWDSIGHMRLMVAIEGSFSIMLETEDLIGFSSYDQGKELLKKYGIEF